MSLGENAAASVAELARLSDELLFLAGDASVDTRWYTRRAALAAVYAATELFMTSDRSPGFDATWRFLDRRLRDVAAAGSVAEGVSGYLGFTAHAVANVLRSKGLRLF